MPKKGYQQIYMHSVKWIYFRLDTLIYNSIHSLILSLCKFPDNIQNWYTHVRKDGETPIVPAISKQSKKRIIIGKLVFLQNSMF